MQRGSQWSGGEKNRVTDTKREIVRGRDRGESK